MVGTLARDKSVYALVRTPDKDIYQVRTGNFMGQNFGVVTGINDTEIKLKELVQDSAGDWTERSSTLQLQQPDANRGADDERTTRPPDPRRPGHRPAVRRRAGSRGAR